MAEHWARAFARRAGAKTYTGDQCRKGHTGLRYTLSNHCVECKKTTDKRWSRNNLDKERARAEKYRTENKEKHRAAVDRWHAANPEKRKQIAASWTKRNPEKMKAYNGANKFIRSQGLKMLTKDQRKQMRDFYENCPEGYHVDHIHPLKGINFCGLHVPWNLQYLLAADNIKKSNKLLEEYVSSHV